MKIVLAIDSFKGSLTSNEAAMAAADGIRRVRPEAEIVIHPVADGGEGTVDALCLPLGGRKEQVMVTGPLGTPVTAEYAILPGGTAVMEMAAAAGLPLVPKERRDPRFTTTYGVGEMIAHAVRQGVRRFLIGIGGSATNDGGVGLLGALGYRFLDENSAPIPPGNAGLARLSQISAEALLPKLAECRFHIACDVTNPLCGDSGASAVYGPQKGAMPAMIAELDRNLAHFAAVSRTVRPAADESQPGAGAAGGLGFAFSAYLSGQLESGITMLLRETGFQEVLRGADLVITGEGRLDGQSAMGKVPVGVAAAAKAQGIPVIALGGAVAPEASALHAYGIDALFPILRSVIPLETAMEREVAKANMADTAEEIWRLIECFTQRRNGSW